MKDLLKKLLPFLTLLFLFLLLSILSPYFLTVDNLSTVARQTAVINIIAIGMTLVIISGGVDLSVGAVLALCGICGTLLMEKGMGVLPATLLGILTGAGWGLLTGLTITTLRVPAFIATLGGLGMARGLTLLITDGRPVTDVPKSFARLGDGSFLGFIPVPVILAHPRCSHHVMGAALHPFGTIRLCHRWKPSSRLLVRDQSEILWARLLFNLGRFDRSWQV